MSEPEFRAWAIKKNEFIDDVIHDSESWLEYEGYETSSLSEIFDGDEFIVEQYTGLKDKNGKMIYEGDILKFRGRYYEVKFDNYGQYCMLNKNYHWLENVYSFRSIDIWCAEGILVEVIGNIHENHELLEIKNDKMGNLRENKRSS